MKLTNAQHVAFELWCILDTQSTLGESVDGVSQLLHIVRQRHPYLSESLLKDGFSLLAAKKFAEYEQRLILRRQRLAYLGTLSARDRP